ncbi:hypothetical protein ABT009_31320 [Streptomyces sp. NPDC002896]|uniref:hypothetical protein n=1 Tax=Streptomyces sp. NPDC002896 TaxID=3154438 RepID=UPI00331D22A3
MLATVVTAILGALGIVGTLAAARIQARGAIRQAEAAVAQAHATHRAAIEAATTQARTSFEQQARAARRPVYLSLVEAGHSFADRLPDLFDGSFTGDTPLESERNAIRVALSRVELEGPSPLINLGRSVLTVAEKAERMAVAMRSELFALYRLGVATGEYEDPSWNEAHYDVALTASSALQRLHQARPSGMSSQDRYAVLREYLLTTDQTYIPDAAAQRSLWEAIREADNAMHGAAHAGVISEGSGRRLIIRAVDRERDATAIFDSNSDAFHAARVRFTEAAREYLHNPSL